MFVESGLIPVPLPGDSILFLAGAFCATGAHSRIRTSISRWWCSGRSSPRSSAAQLGYALGHRYGTRLFKVRCPSVQDGVSRTSRGVLRHAYGRVRWCLARFIPFVRTIIPILAGTGRMAARKFALANVAGAAIWAVGISLLGFWLGKSINIDKYIYPIVAVIIILSLIPPFLEYRKHRRTTSDRG